MVGALADWFAVTALFRRPLGLPIPHTAIIPTKKDALGDSLGEFVGENFLAEDVVRDKLARVEVGQRGSAAGSASAANADRVTAELATAARGVVTVLRDDDVQEIIEQVLVRKLMEKPLGPPLGTVLQGVLADGAHHRLVDLVCDRAYDWVSGNQEMVLRIVHERAPGWTPRFLDDIVADKVFAEVQNFAWAVKTDPEHPLRKAIDTFLVEFAIDLQNDPDTIERAERHQAPGGGAPRRAEVHRAGLGHGEEADPRRGGGPVQRAARCGCATGCWASASGCRPIPSCARSSTAGSPTPRATSCGTTGARSPR